MSYPIKPTGNDIIPEDTIFAKNNLSKQAMTSSEILGGYNNDGDLETDLTSRPDANRFNNFWYQMQNTLVWVMKYAEELYADKFSKNGGSVSGNIIMTSGAKVTGVPTPTLDSDAVPKSYVDGLATGSSGMWLGEVKCLSFPQIPVSPTEDFEIVPCDGRALSRTDYASLFSLIGVSFGNGDGSTTFNIPDYNNGLFLRGWGGNYNPSIAKRDSGRIFGSVQNSGAPTIEHTHGYSGNTSNVGNHTHSEYYAKNQPSGLYDSIAEGNKYFIQLDAITNTGGAGAHTHTYSGTTGTNSNVSGVYQNISEVRPVNSTCYYIIRIK